MSVSTGTGGDLRDVREHARRAERMGYDAIEVGETQHDPFLSLLMVAEHTERLILATSVAIAFPRAPYVMANVAWDLARFSGGRLVLGLGTQVKGHIERRFSVPWLPPGPRMRDYIRCMRAIWDSWQNGTKPDYQGEFYQYRLTSPFFNPGPIEHPDIPIIVSAVNPFNARLAGEVCDGIALHPMSSVRYTRDVLLPVVLDGARKAGKRPDDLRIQGGGFVVTGRTEQEVAEARERTRRQISFYASTRSYRNVMQTHGWEDEAAHLHRLSMIGEWDQMVSVVTDDMLEAFCVIGAWDEIAARMRARYAGINTQVSFSADPTNPDEEAQIAEIVALLKMIPTFGETRTS